MCFFFILYVDTCRMYIYGHTNTLVTFSMNTNACLGCRAGLGLRVDGLGQFRFRP